MTHEPHVNPTPLGDQLRKIAEAIENTTAAIKMLAKTIDLMDREKHKPIQDIANDRSKKTDDQPNQ